MPTARTGASAVVLNGQVYVMGGIDAQGKVLDVVERYDPATGIWQNAPKLRTARFNAAAVVYDGNIYMMGGQDSLGLSTKKVEVFIPSENDWNSFDNLNDEREGLGAVVLNNELYVMGGSNGSANILDSVEILDAAEEKWEYSPNWILDVPRALFAYVVVDDAAYSIGGFSSFGPMGLLQRYDDSGTDDLAPLMPGRGGLAAAYLDNSIYAMGGRRSNNEVVKTVNRYLIDENRWETAPEMKIQRERFAAVAIGDEILVFGGNTSSGEVLNSVEAFVTSVAPNTTDDVLITNEDTGMSVNVLVNDEDPSGGTLSISSFSQPAHGAVSQLTGDTFNYVPSKDYFGQDQFTYTVMNQTGGTAVATVNVTVQPVNDSPVFSSTPVTGAAQDALYSYSVTALDVDLDALSFEGVVLPSWLSLTDMQNGTALLQGTPGAGALGDHAVTVSVSDGVASVEQQFTLTVVEGAPAEAVLISPPDGVTDLPSSITLVWSIEGAATFDIEVSLDALFAGIFVEATGLSESSYLLEGLEDNTTYFWRVRGMNAAGAGPWSAAYAFTTAQDTANEREAPGQDFVLLPNYPNPFTTYTWIEFELADVSSIPPELEIFDLQGRRIVRLHAAFSSPGRQSVQWDARDASGDAVSSGTYLVVLRQGGRRQTRLITLIR